MLELLLRLQWQPLMQIEAGVSPPSLPLTPETKNIFSHGRTKKLAGPTTNAEPSSISALKSIAPPQAEGLTSTTRHHSRPEHCFRLVV